MDRKDYLRCEFSYLNFMRETLKGKGTQMKSGKYIAEIRKDIKILFRKDPLALPITEEWRRRYSEDGELGVDYKIFKDIWRNDDEIQEFVDKYIGYAPYYSQYDCTGKPFTYYKHWKRTPAGIVVIHRWALDV